MKQRRSTPYDDIIELPHHVSPDRPRMPAIDRAAQFSPFAALTGYDAAIKETARLTEARAELDETQKQELNERLLLLMECIETRPEATITYFVPDRRKSGGEYVTVTGRVKRIAEYDRAVLLTDGVSIPIDDIYGVELSGRHALA